MATTLPAPEESLSTNHPLRADELRAIAAWLEVRNQMKVPARVTALFVSEGRRPMHRSNINLLLQKYSDAASLPLRAHPHMLRHGCGLALADQGADTRLIQDFLGHRNIQHTVRYTACNPGKIPAALAVKDNNLNSHLESAGFATGEILHVDGGQSAGY